MSDQSHAHTVSVVGTGASPKNDTMKTPPRGDNSLHCVSLIRLDTVFTIRFNFHSLGHNLI